MVVPADKALTTPLPEIVAVVVLLLLQLPPDGVEASDAELPAQ